MLPYPILVEGNQVPTREQGPALEGLFCCYVHPDYIASGGIGQGVRISECIPWVVEAPRLIGVIELPDTHQVVCRDTVSEDIGGSRTRRGDVSYGRYYFDR